MNKLFVLSISMLLSCGAITPASAEFRFGACCSANGGVCACRGGGAVCCDGKESTCACDEKDFVVVGTVSAKETPVASVTVPAEHVKFLPNKNLTPGDIRSSDSKEICKAGYITSLGKTPQSSKDKVFDSYKIKRRSDYEIDHLVSKGLGGSSDIKNLYPQPHRSTWSVAKKDQLENHMHRMMCSGKIGLEQAQREIATDWITAYKKYIGATPATPAKKSKQQKAKKAKAKQPAKKPTAKPK